MMRPRWKYLLFGIVLVFAFWLRIDAADWGLPFRLHPDEWKYVQGAAKVHQGQWNPKYFRNPPGFTYSNALWYPIWLNVSPEVSVPDWYPAKSLQTNTVVETYQQKPYQLVYGARVLSACFGVGLVIVTMLLSSWMRLGFRTTLIASLLMAVSFTGVRESHFAVNDSSMAFWAVLSVAAGLYSIQKNAVRYLYLAAMLSGIAVAFKYSAYPAVIAIILFRLTPFLKLSLFTKTPIPLIRDVCLLSVIPILTFLLICPFPVIDTPTFMDEMRKLSDAAASGWQGQENVWSGVLLFDSLWRSEGVISLLLAVFGGWFFIKEKQWAFLLFPVLYVLMLMTSPLYFTRFSLPLIPFLVIVSAYTISQLSYKVNWIGTIYALTILAVIQPLASSLRSNDLLKQEDSRIQALRWLLEQNEEGVMAAGQFELPLVYWETSEPWSIPTAFNIDGLPSNQLNRLDNSPVRWIAVSTFSAFPGKIDDTFRERLQSVIQYTGSNQTVQAFTVFYRNNHTANSTRDIVRSVSQADVEDSYSPTTRLWQRERPGPEILIFSRTPARTDP